MNFSNYGGIKLLICLSAAQVLVPTSGFAYGVDGRRGDSGINGRAGRSGQNAVITASDTFQSLNLDGANGEDGLQGEDGSSATSCVQPAKTGYNQYGADGGDGGRGGNGGSGGDGGSTTIYYQNIAQVKNIFISSVPGRNGRPAWGGRGGQACRCQVYEWTVGEGANAKTYHCDDGKPGSNGGTGLTGSNGQYGEILLIPQLTPIPAEVNSVNIDIGRMQNQQFTVSKNYWLQRSNANAVLAPGSRVADKYWQFQNRVEFTYSFEWKAARPISDFNGWKMILRVEGQDAKLLTPQEFLFTSETIQTGTHRHVVIKSALSVNEINRIGIGDISGDGASHVVKIDDGAGVSNQVETEVFINFQTVDKANWVPRFKGKVPADALITEANGITIQMAKLGVPPEALKAGTRAYIAVEVTRKIGDFSQRYSLGDQRYMIEHAYAVGEVVVVSEDGNLMRGNTVVGHVKKGEQYKVAKLQDGWISLVKLDGTTVEGWIQPNYLEPLL